MNILVVTDNYLTGGLENNIATYYNELKDKNNFYFCVSTYEDNKILESDNIYKDFHFNYNVSLSDFLSDVNRMIKIIKEKKIDFIQVHPFYGLYVAWLAANQTNTKLIYTYHGIISLNYTVNLFDEILTEYIFEKSVSLALCVSDLGEQGFNTINFNKTKLLPNPVNVSSMEVSKVNNNKKWALITRLDTDKVPSIIKLFEMLPEIDIDQVDVYGEGNERESLEALASKCSKKINFMGYHNDLDKILKDKYNGVIGIGRAAIEGLAMGYPLLFVGHGKVCGLLDEEMYDRARRLNFVATDFETMDAEKINSQLAKVDERYILRDRVVEDFDIKNLAKKYVEYVKEAQNGSLKLKIDNIYNRLTKLNEEKPDIEFHNSNEVYVIVKDEIFFDTNNIAIKNKLLIKDYVDEKYKNDMKLKQSQDQNQIKDLNDKIDNLSKELETLRNQYRESIEYLSDNLNLKWVIKNDFKKFKKKK